MQRGECCTNLAAKLWESPESGRWVLWNTYLKQEIWTVRPLTPCIHESAQAQTSKMGIQSEQKLQTLNPPLFLYPIFASFIIYFEQSKWLWWVWQAKLYINFLGFRKCKTWKESKDKKIGEKPRVCWGVKFHNWKQGNFRVSKWERRIDECIYPNFNNSLPLAEYNSIAIIYPHFEYPCYELNNPLL
jgi:hypothetical protein